MTPVSVVVVGSSPLTHDDPNIQVGQGLADRLGGCFDLVVPAGAAEPGLVDLHPVRVHRVAARGRLPYLVAARRAVDRIAMAKWQVLMSSNPLAAVVVETSRARRTVPHIFHVQGEIVRPGPEYGGPAKRLALAAVTRMAVRRASGVRVVNEPLRAAVEQWAGGPVAVVGSRVDTGLFRPREDGLLPGGPDAVMVGGLATVKNHETVLRAWPQVVREVPGARLTIAGEGGGRPRLEALIARLGLGRHVELPGRVPHAQVAGLLAAARCLIHPSWSEGHPRAVLEGMSCGLPVICSDIPAHREIVVPETGLLVPPGNVRAWAAAIVRTLRDPAGAAAMGARGRALVVARHDLVGGLDRYAAFIRDVAARHHAAVTS